ncbi:MAG: RNA-binding transcriptional accessory protein [Clostridium sp.]|nr:RNA-binding transcriptional accessory protein [Clostridium sp.]MCM1548259.1 RNA-binding transcriptional accessory protein [Ruminococcus sp.]
MDINKTLAEEFKLRQEQVDNTVSLIDDGKTIPFIARYRKELTGSLDDQILRELSDRLTYLRNLETRKSEVRASIEEQGKLTDEISAALEKAAALVEVEDIYRPFKPKRKTRASAARERGLEPLAELIKEQQSGSDPDSEAEKYIDPEKEIASAGDALQGAMDIIAEDISDDAEIRKKIRSLYERAAKIESKACDEEEETVYRNYYDFSEPVSKIAGHRVLALDRGEKEGKLKIAVAIDEEFCSSVAESKYIKGSGRCSELVKLAAHDSCKRLIMPSVEREIRAELTEKAAEGAIKVFASNLRQLLLQPPVKNSVILGFDPGYAHGCKTAVVDMTGKVLDTAIVYPTFRKGKDESAKAKIKSVIEKNGVTAVAIGNGTASRESEALIAEILHEIPRKVSYIVVSEAGASVYSASKLAAEEFPEFDVSLRSAVSIARRLQDPLAELVKIDPKAIGVGQYQHDMPKARMNEALGGVVEDCVNSVGVDLNTASHSLLSYISGVNASVAKNIVAYREENGAFTDRKQLLKVPKLGKKAYEQCAGFLRVRDGKNPLDNTAVHPESYDAAKALMNECGFKLADIGTPEMGRISDAVRSDDKKSLCEKLGIGLPTLNDIISELQKPGRDPRDELPPPLMRSGDIMEIKDLKPGMEMMGTVRNVIDFGAFVDIGVHEDGLVHISQICDRYIKHPLEAVKVGEVVKVRVLDVDVKRNRISLTMKTENKGA